mmetsp:Transcript_33081/g.72034  ORF Transcript_33081/g.72034 Transcript_33081/m.72034 type:complete len:274 (+) Transcript_33081:170-991(+)
MSCCIKAGSRFFHSSSRHEAAPRRAPAVVEDQRLAAPRATHVVDTTGGPDDRARLVAAGRVPVDRMLAGRLVALPPEAEIMIALPAARHCVLGFPVALLRLRQLRHDGAARDLHTSVEGEDRLLSPGLVFEGKEAVAFALQGVLLSDHRAADESLVSSELAIILLCRTLCGLSDPECSDRCCEACVFVHRPRDKRPPQRSLHLGVIAINGEAGHVHLCELQIHRGARNGPGRALVWGSSRGRGGLPEEPREPHTARGEGPLRKLPLKAAEGAL